MIQESEQLKYETEAYGVNYERLAMVDLQKALISRYGWKTVFEFPAHGLKAMPSLYSLGFALAGASVWLGDGVLEAKEHWKDAGVADKLHFDSPPHPVDLCWNFHALPLQKNPDDFLQKMENSGAKHFFFINVNRANPGFLSHRLAHWWTGIPWTHGDCTMMSKWKFSAWLEKRGYRILESDFVDIPFWPDSLGFRDIRLHRAGKDQGHPHWVVPSIDWIVNGNAPLWAKSWLPVERRWMPYVMRIFIGHLFYIVAEKKE